MELTTQIVQRLFILAHDLDKIKVGDKKWRPVNDSPSFDSQTGSLEFLLSNGSIQREITVEKLHLSTPVTSTTITSDLTDHDTIYYALDSLPFVKLVGDDDIVIYLEGASVDVIIRLLTLADQLEDILLNAEDEFTATAINVAERLRQLSA